MGTSAWSFPSNSDESDTDTEDDDGVERDCGSFFNDIHFIECVARNIKLRSNKRHVRTERKGAVAISECSRLYFQRGYCILYG